MFGHEQQNNFQHQEHFYSQEDKIARELQKRKLEDESKRREIDKIFMESEELKELKQKIKIAQVTRERTKQMAENQLRRVQKLEQDIDQEDMILRKVQEEQNMERNKQALRTENMLKGKHVLKQQMQEKQLSEQEAYQQYLLEKGQVDGIMQKIIDEDRNAYETGKVKKKQAYQDMVDTLEDKERRYQELKEYERQQNEKYKQFHAGKDQQAADIKEAKRLEELKKQALFEKLKEAEEIRRREKEELENLRSELYKEEWDANERRKDREEKEKRHRQMLEMQQAERDNKDYKQRILQEEAQMEQEFRKNMMAKFAEDERLEQLSQQRRRQKEMDHKKEVERLWQEKLNMYRQARDQELREREQGLDIERQKEDLIAQEKIRLLKEFGSEIDGFMPKGLLKDPKETQYLEYGGQGKQTGYGQNFKNY